MRHVHNSNNPKMRRERPFNNSKVLLSSLDPFECALRLQPVRHGDRSIIERTFSASLTDIFHA